MIKKTDVDLVESGLAAFSILLYNEPHPKKTSSLPPILSNAVKREASQNSIHLTKTVRIKFLVQARPLRARGRCQMSRDPFEPQPHNLGELLFHKIVYRDYRAAVGAGRLR